jgi:hypothetical protein
MTASEPSSVVFSIQELLSTESLRVEAENTERQAQLALDQQRRQQELEAERLSVERKRSSEHEHERHQQMLDEVDIAKRQWAAQNAVELARLRRQLEQEYRTDIVQAGPKGSDSSGVRLIFVATLITLLLGAIGSWIFVILPGERRAETAYTSLQETYTSLLREHQASADSWGRQRQQLKLELESTLKELNSKSTQTADPASDRAPSTGKPNSSGRQPHAGPRPSEAVRTCACLRGDPLCDC